MNHLTVAQFNEIINIQLGSLGEFEIEGEVTSINITPKGGVFMTLKDQVEPAIVNLTGYKPTIEGFDLIEEGMLIVVYGTAGIYSPNGRFSISVRKVKPQGEGALTIAYQKLKEKLEKEGLFDQSRKRELPRIITKISLITGKDSAAYTDFIKIIKENGLSLNIDYYPVHVQGDHAVKDIALALDAANKSDSDIIVIVRGGGSLEDLASFNDETLARLIYSSDKPTIVGVGHERDESIADFIADLRASTPSQAAYYIIDNVSNLLASNELIVEQIYNSILKKIEWDTVRIGKIVDYIENKVDTNFVVSDLLMQKVMMLSKTIDFMLDSKIEILRSIPILEQTVNSKLDLMNSRVQNVKDLINAYNPDNVMKKGYSLLKKDNKIITNISELNIDEKINLLLHDGSAESRILSINVKNNADK